MSDFLEKIGTLTRQRLAEQKKLVPIERLRDQEPPKRSPTRFGDVLRSPGAVTVIAEMKQASPSAGVIRIEDDFEGRVRGYTQGGAAAISVLTERDYFRGSTALFERARKETSVPILRKDFIIDEYQIEESKALGADAILLMVSLLPPPRLSEFLEMTKRCGLDALVEVHDELELSRALDANAPVIGVNNRDLRSLIVDPKTAERLVPLVSQAGKTVVVESGIREPSQLESFRQWGANAVLIGETLMREPNAEKIVRDFVTAGQG